MGLGGRSVSSGGMALLENGTMTGGSLRQVTPVNEGRSDG